MLLNDWRLWVLAGAALLTLVLSVLVVSAKSRNFEAGKRAADRQAYITQTIRLRQVNQTLIQYLATAAAQTNDAQIANLLARHGVTYRVNAPPSGGADAEQP